MTVSARLTTSTANADARARAFGAVYEAQVGAPQLGQAAHVLRGAARHEQALRALLPTIVITRGERGSVIYDQGERYEIPVVPPEKPGEPTGVGDAYRAGLIVGFLHGFPWPVTGRIASLAATYVLEQHGTQEHHYSLAEFVARYRRVFADTPELAALTDRAQ